MRPTSAWITADQQSDEDLVDLASGGDDHALEELIQRLNPMIRAKAKTYFLSGGDRQDVIQEGLIGLYKAVCDYDRSRHPSFRHFADLCVTRQVITAVKRSTRHKHAPLNAYASLSEPAADDAEGGFVAQLVAKDSDPADLVQSIAAVLRLRTLCHDVLTALEQDVLTRYARGDSYAVIATQLGRSHKAVDNAVQRIKHKLGERLEADEPTFPSPVWGYAA